MRADGLDELEMRLQLCVAFERIARILEPASVPVSWPPVAKQVRKDVLKYLQGESSGQLKFAASSLAASDDRDKTLFFETIPRVIDLVNLPPESQTSSRIVAEAAQFLKRGRSRSDTTPGSRGPLPRELARQWILDIFAWDHWRRIRSKIRALTIKLVNREGWKDIVSQCGELQQQVDIHSKRLVRDGMENKPISNELNSLRDLFPEISRMLDFSISYFEKSASLAPAENKNANDSARLEELIDWVDRISTNKTWPVIELLGLLDQLEKENVGRTNSLILAMDESVKDPVVEEWIKDFPDWLKKQPETVARLILLRALVTTLIRDIPSSTIWRQVVEFAEKILSSSGLKADILLDPDDLRARILTPSQGSFETPRHLTSPALVFSDGKDLHAFTDARLVKPRARSAETQSLLGLARYCRNSAGNEHLAELFSELANDWGDLGVREWLKQTDSSDFSFKKQSRLWLAVQNVLLLVRTDSDSFEAVDLFLQSLDVCKIHPARWGQRSNLTEIEVSQPWFVARRVPDELPPDLAFGPAIDIDGSIFGTCIWLSVEPARLESQPLLRFLERAQPYLALIWVSDREWSGLLKLNVSTWKECFSKNDEESDSKLAIDLFLQLYGRAIELEAVARNDLAKEYFFLARNLQETVISKIDPQFPLRLNPKTDRIEALNRATARLEIRWQINPQPVGTVLSLKERSVSGQIAADVSCGPHFHQRFLEWSQVSIPNEMTVLKTWQTALSTLVWTPELIPAQLDRAKIEFAQWLDTPTGQDCFHHLIQDVVSIQGGESNSRKLWELLREDFWCRVFPEIDLQTSRLFWPPEITPIGINGIRLQCCELKSGDVLPNDVRFSHRAELARCTVSLGESVVGSPLHAALEMHARATLVPLGLRDHLTLMTERIVKDEQIELLQPTVTDAKVLSVLDDLVVVADSLSMANQSSDSKANHLRISSEVSRGLDEFLIGFDDWCRIRGYGRTPSDWSFMRPSTFDKLPQDCDARIVFRDAIERGHVFRLAVFGLLRHEEILRSPIAQVSAGREPLHFSDVLHQLLELPDGHDRWVPQLRDWPRALLTGRLEYAAIKLFEELWSPQIEEQRSSFASVFDQAIEYLTTMLASEFQLYSFSPTVQGQFPSSWVEVISSEGIRTGRVRRVLRPGLRDENNLMRLQAVVEMD